MSVAADLQALPPPAIVEELDFATIRARLLDRIAAEYPDLADVLGLESEPLVKLAEAVAYEALLIRARINAAADAVFLPRAQGSDLDQLAALFGVTRLVVTPANPVSLPPTPPVSETDDGLRTRVLLSLEGISTAGPRQSYVYHALSADGRVRDVAVDRPEPGEVRVVFYAEEADGSQTAAPLAAIEAALNDEYVRPLCTDVTVLSATPVTFAVEAEVEIEAGASAAAVTTAARQAVLGWLATARQPGREIPRAKLISALDVPGVRDISLIAPAADVAVAVTEVGIATGVTVTEAAP